MLRQVRLYGLAGKRFGRCFTLDVGSPAEAIRALSSQLKGFREFVAEHSFRVVCGEGLGKGIAVSADTCDFLFPSGAIHFAPVTAGAGGNGTGKIIAGVILLAVAFFVPFGVLGATSLTGALGTSIFAGFSYGNLAILGVSMLAAGVSQMMAKPDVPEDPTAHQSFQIDGDINVTQQGGPVPLIYGQTQVGSTLISAGVTTIDIAEG